MYEALAVLALIAIWDLGRRFASRGQAVTTADLETLEDRLTLAEAQHRQVVDLAAKVDDLRVCQTASSRRLDEIVEKHNVVAATVARHGQALTVTALGRK